MANTTFSGAVRSKAGFKVINEDSSTGAITETGVNINSTGQLVSLGTRKIQTFAIDLSSTNAAGTTYADNDVLVELGELNTDHPDALVTASIFPTSLHILRIVGQSLNGSPLQDSLRIPNPPVS